MQDSEARPVARDVGDRMIDIASCYRTWDKIVPRFGVSFLTDLGIGGESPWYDRNYPPTVGLPWGKDLLALSGGCYEQWEEHEGEVRCVRTPDRAAAVFPMSLYDRANADHPVIVLGAAQITVDLVLDFLARTQHAPTGTYRDNTSLTLNMRVEGTLPASVPGEFWQEVRRGHHQVLLR